MGALTKTLYETDFVEWAERTAELLRQRRFEDVDLEHLIEEVMDLGLRDERAARSQMRRLLLHLIEVRIQPERAGTSWRRSVVGARGEIEDLIDDSPGIRRHLEQALQEIYRRAVRQALDETNLTAQAKTLDIPETCPYTLSELLEVDLNSLLPPR